MKYLRFSIMQKNTPKMCSFHIYIYILLYTKHVIKKKYLKSNFPAIKKNKMTDSKVSESNLVYCFESFFFMCP